MADPKLTIIIEQKGADGVQKSLKEIRKEGDTTVTTIKKGNEIISQSFRTVTGQTKNLTTGLTALNTGYLALRTVYQDVKGSLDGLIGAGIEELDSIRKRDTALKNAGDATLKYKGKLEDQAQQFMNSLGVADDYTRAIQAQLLIQHKAPEDIGMMTQAVIGLTLQQDIGTDAAAKQIARFVEFGGTLRGTTLKANEHSSAQDRLRQVLEFTTTGIEAQRKKMSENEGQIQAAKVKYEELRETLGLKLLPVVGNLATKFGSVLDTFNKLDPSAQNVVLFGAAAAAGVGPLIIALGQVITAVKVIKDAGLLSFIGKSSVPAAAVAAAVGATSIGMQKPGPSVGQNLAPGFTSVLNGNPQPPAGGFKSMVKSGGGGDWTFQQGAYMNAMVGGGPLAGLTPVDQNGNPMGGYGGNRRNWWDRHGSDYTQVASGFLSGGARGGFAAAGSLAGNAILPGLGGLLGGLLGGGIGKLFGGGHKKRQGETPAQPIYTSDMNLQRLVTDLLNVTKMSIVRGASGGIDAGVKMLNAQNARAGV